MWKRYAWPLAALTLGTVGSAALLSRSQGQVPPPAPPRQLPADLTPANFVPPSPPENARWYLPWRYGRWRSTRSSP